MFTKVLTVFLSALADGKFTVEEVVELLSSLFDFNEKVG